MRLKHQFSRFPKCIRLLKRKEFLSVDRIEDHEALKGLGSYLILLGKPNSNPQSRIGITASKRFGKAHQRNLFKRQVREAFRLNYTTFPQGLDFVVKPRRGALKASFQEIQQELIELSRAFDSPKQNPTI